MPHILVIEDNPGDVDLLRLALKSADCPCELTVLEDGGEAIAMIRGKGKYAAAPVPDLAVLDLNIPKNDGIQILASMRASEAYQQIPVMVLSSSSAPRDRAKLEKAGVAQFRTKPTDLDEFLTIGADIKQMLTARSHFETGSAAVTVPGCPGRRINL